MSRFGARFSLEPVGTFPILLLRDAAPATPAAKTQYEDTIIKVWCNFTDPGTAASAEDVGVSSVDDDATGNYGFNYATAMSTNTYAAAAMSHLNGDGVATDSTATGSLEILRYDNGGTSKDGGGNFIVVGNN